MSKISGLPEATDLDGNETVVMVKAGTTRRGALAGLVGAAVAPHVQAAEVAAAVATAEVTIYASLAEGEAATVAGETFFVDNGDLTATLYRRTAGVSEKVYDLLTKALIAGPGGADGVGSAQGATVQAHIDAYAPARNMAAATRAAGLANGSIVQMEGLLYEVDSSATGTASATYDLGVDGLIPHGPIAFEHFGAPASTPTLTRQAMQRCMDYASSLGLAFVSAKSAEYEVDRPIRHRSFVHVDLRGAAIINNTNDIVNFNNTQCWRFGDVRSTGFSGNVFDWPAHGVASASQGAVTITLATGAGASYAVGDVVQIYSDERAAADPLQWRYYQQQGRITGISGDDVTLDNPIYADVSGYTLNITKPDPGFTGPGDDPLPVAVCQRFSLANGIMHSEYGRWTGTGLAYDGEISNLKIRRTLSLLAVNGFAYVTVSGLTGKFADMGINTAYFSHDNVVRDVQAGWDGRPGTVADGAAFYFEEGVHHCERINCFFAMGAAPGVVNAARFTKSASFNTVSGGGFADVKAVSNPDILFTWTTAGGSSADAPKGGNVVRGLNLYRPLATGYCVSESTDFAATRKGARNVLEGFERVSGASATGLANLGGSDVQVRDVTATTGGIVVNANARGISVRDIDVTGQRTFTVTDNSGVADIRGIRSSSAPALLAAARQSAQFALSSTITSGAVAATYSIPANTLELDDVVTLNVSGVVAGTGGVRHIEIWAVGVDSGGSPLSTRVADLAIPGASGATSWDIALKVSIRSLILQRASAVTRYGAVVASDNKQTANYTDLGALAFEIRRWVDNGSDSVTVYDAIFDTLRPRAR